ncbi:MAG: cytochrome c [Flavobacteriaceae bacterium]
MKTFLFSYLAIVLGFSVYLFQDPTLEASVQRGSEIYADFCITCHMAQGEGVATAFPPLAKSDYLQNNREGSIRGIKFGQQGELVVNGVIYNSVMAPMGLEDEEVADVMNYILNSWGNTSDKMVTVEEVEAIQKK